VLVRVERARAWCPEASDDAADVSVHDQPRHPDPLDNEHTSGDAAVPADAVPSADLFTEPAPREAPPEPPELPPPDSQSGPATLRSKTSRREDPWAHRRGEPRTFAVVWIVFMVAAIAVSLIPIGETGLRTVEAYRPTARVLAGLLGLGVGVVWPLIRLSQVRPLRPGRALGQDLWIIAIPAFAMCAAQMAPWMAAWPLSVAATLSGMIVGWALLVGGVMLHAWSWEAARQRTGDEPDAVPSRAPAPRGPDAGVAAHPDSTVRALAMALLIAIAAIGPLIWALGFDAGQWRETRRGLGVQWSLLTSPIGAPLEITADRTYTGRSAAIGEEHLWALALVFAVGLVLIATHRWYRPRPPAATVSP
jgi:hypothetical protein